MLNLSDIKTYWKNAAIRNKAIGHVEGGEKHFSSYTAEEALATIKDMKYPYLAAELPEIHMGDANSDNVRMNFNGGILILKKATAGDYLKIQAAYDEMFIIGRQLLTKLYNDRKKANDYNIPMPEAMMKQLDIPLLNMVEVGPVFDSCYGWRINYQINTPDNLELDESEWDGETKWKF